MIEQRVLIIGGGFLGKALAESLILRGDRITLLSRHGDPSTLPRGSAIVRGSQENKTLMAELLHEHTTVIHAAWGTTPSSSAGHPEVEGLLGLIPFLSFLEVLQRFPEVRLLFLSSGGTVYGNPGRLPVTEDQTLQPLSCHGVSKVGAESFIQVMEDGRKCPSLILRPSNIYGPGQILRSGFGVVPHLLHCATENVSFHLRGDGLQVRDYLYIDDFLDAVKCLMECNVKGTFNLGSGSGTSLRELIELVEKTTGRLIHVEPHPPSISDVDRVTLDIQKISNLTGWTPNTSLVQGIVQTWRWFKEFNADEKQKT